MIEPSRPRGIWVITEFHGWVFAHALAFVFDMENQLVVGTGDLTDEEREKAQERIKLIHEQSQFMGLSVSERIADGLISRLADGELSRPGTVQALVDLEQAVSVELQRHAFASVHPSRVQYFEQTDLFGKDVSLVFPLAVPDINDAGNCFALGLYTASVFHVMRAAEHGARHVARSLGLKMLKGKKPVPVEYATWDKIARQIGSKIEAEHKKNPSAARAARLNYWSEMVAHILAFKDAWRDDVMHSRKPYGEHEASSILDHVRGFMQRVAKGPV
jgi:hypothetical protein